MKHLMSALVLGSAALGAGAALADTTYIVDKVTIAGSKTVPPEKLYAVIQEHKGSRVTQADIIADQDAITKVLGQSNVGGGIKTSMAQRGNSNHIEVTFLIEDRGVQAPIVTKVAPKLHEEIFVGNNALTTDQLIAATGWKPGDELSNEKLTAAQKAIAAAYKGSKKPVSMTVTGSTKSLGNGTVDVTWTIVETKAKRKRDTEDEGEKLEQ